MKKQDMDPEKNGCARSCRQVEVPTEDEVAALGALKGIKERVRDLKKRISLLSDSESTEDSRRLSDMKAELAGLKREWTEWEEKRKAAARERMILLGHEE